MGFDFGGAAGGIGGFLGAVGDLKAGAAAENAGLHNAAIDEQNAVWAREKAKNDERALDISSRKQIGQARANYGASGVEVSGSPLDILQESAVAAKKDALNIRFQGEQQYYSYMNQAYMDRMQGKTAKEASYYSAAGTFLSGASKAASSGSSYSSGPTRTQ